MVKSDLVKKITEQYPDLTIEQVERIVKLFFEQIIKTLVRGERTEIRGLGTFYTKTTSKRIGRNPKNKAVIDIPQKRIPCFRASSKMDELLN